MIKLLLTFITIISLTTSLQAEIVKNILINGNKRVSSETIKIYGDFKLDDDLYEKDLNKILSNLYSTNFFSDVNVQLLNNTLKIDLIEYPVINNLVILGEPSKKYLEQLQKALSLKEKDSFIKSNLKKDTNIIKQLYSSLGYNFVKVETKIRNTSEGNVDLIFDIEKGETTKITKITFLGDKKIRERRLRDVIASSEDKFWKVISRNSRYSENRVNLDTRLLANYYKSIGYYDVKISSNSAEIKKSGNVELIYSIDAGTRYSINKITTNVDPVFDKDLFYSLNDKYQKVIGSYYSPFKITKLLEEIDELIADNDLQFVEHNVEKSVNNDSIDIKFNIFEGEKILVERINITGNNITNESVIRGELVIDEGDPFTKLGLDKSIANIKSRNIFRDVKSNQSEGSSKDLKVIDIKVEEKPTGEISAGAGIGTNGGSFAFNVKENNWLGEGKNVGFNADVSADSLKGSINYSDPNYDFLGNSINYSLSSSSNDASDAGYENTLTSAGISTAFEQYKDVYASLGLSASYDDLKTNSTATDSIKKQSGTFSEVAATYGFSFDKRNRSFMPTDGSIIGFKQSLPIYADKSFIGNNLTVSKYKTISENVITAVKFYGASINGINDDVRLNKRVNLSNKRLRGFKKNKVGPKDGKDFVGGNFASAINFEASLPNLLPESTKTDVGLFLDFGNVWGVDYDSTVGNSNKLRSSTGVQVSWLSPLGPLAFTFAKNLSKAGTDGVEGFNFNLGTTF